MLQAQDKPAPPARLLPEADAYTESGAPNNNYGTSSALTANNLDTTEIFESYLRFNLATVTGTVKKATLKICALNYAGGNTQVYHLADSGDKWGEGTTTWNNRPTDGMLLGVLVAPKPADVTLDVTAAVKAELTSKERNKLLSLRLAAPYKQGNAFWSREKSAELAPCLLLEYQ